MLSQGNIISDVKLVGEGRGLVILWHQCLQHKAYELNRGRESQRAQLGTCLFTDLVHMVAICHEMYISEQNYRKKFTGSTKYFRDGVSIMELCLYMLTLQT